MPRKEIIPNLWIVVRNRDLCLESEEEASHLYKEYICESEIDGSYDITNMFYRMMEEYRKFEKEEKFFTFRINLHHADHLTYSEDGERISFTKEYYDFNRKN